ncbi:hypothetical protein Psed_5231 [Pseudonocardia dioxanivorans CB1190]|uniref:Uncharacterized protein n=1 Tax=Pseudonocardia dioxanivorans (strain ATCC 55486 / DSM 44775 / JCM 13855 / CB1190) TaxID=675635 RepID=F4CTE2_PSEUX|nr:hypothetical protein [Pseudonocardia dioxanivorans]AEA27367.1 hypothetical protein Psed_5231 [Pseudonocardia dioxanivorans CB1190]
MTATLDHPTTPTPSPVNARGEATFLRAAGYTLTARELVHALATHLARYGDTLAVRVVDPLAAVDAVMRFDLAHRHAQLTAWTAGRSPADVATVLARAEAIARDYFGAGFPALTW